MIVRAVFCWALAALANPREQVPVVFATALKAFDPKAELDVKCISDDTASNFNSAVDKIIDQMMEKRKKKMRLGLRDLGGAVDYVGNQVKAGCPAADVGRIQRAAQKLVRFSGDKANIEYEVKKTLKVAGADIHGRVNGWIGAYKNVKTAEDAGKELGELLLAIEDASDAKAEL
mmetsp:Transcript_28230/g.67809  ORF Transcript_28230/g.67809 Transcript_28230/m.67809 type:complete len:174 (-) Transcript_28230:54-575(-)